MHFRKCLVLAALLLGGWAAAQPPPSVQAEVTALRAKIAAVESDDENWADLAPRLDRQLESIAVEAAAGRELLALHRLVSTHNTLLAYLFRLERGSGDFAAVLAGERERLGARPPITAVPAAHRAMAEAARERMRPYVSASGPYAAASSTGSGLFYLGRARGFGEYVDLCNRLGAGVVVAPSPKLRSLDAELETLEREILAAYRPPLSIERHSDFIGLHASLKLARELDEGGSRFGALYQYVDAAVQLARIVPAAGTDDPAALRETANSLRSRLEAGREDHGIAQVFLQMADSALARTEDSTAGDPALAAAVLHKGLPLYFEAVASRGRERPAARPEVTVTLVRWPYT